MPHSLSFGDSAVENRVSRARMISTQVLWGYQLIHPPSTPWPGALLICKISDAEVWLCRVLQTLPKITPGNARMNEGAFPAIDKF